MNDSSRTTNVRTALVIALGLTLGLLTGCGKQPQTRDSTEAAPGSHADPLRPAPEEEGRDDESPTQEEPQHELGAEGAPPEGQAAEPD